MRGMAILIVLGLAACKNEPTFDKRYETAQERIEDKAKEIDQELGSPQTGQKANDFHPHGQAD